MAVVLCALAVCLLCPQGVSAAVTVIGGPGVGNGTFNVPGSDAVDTSGNLYVLDPNRGTLQKFGNGGEFNGEISGEFGPGARLPEDDLGGIAIDGTKVFVTDGSGSGLLEFDTSSLGYHQMISTGVTPLSVAAGLKEHDLYVVGITSGHYVLEKYAESGTKLLGPVTPAVATPNKNLAIHDQIAVDEMEDVFVTDADAQRVIELNSNLEVLRHTITGLTGYAQAIATGSVGGVTQVYVGDDSYSGSAFVRRYSPAGEQLGAISVGGAHGGLASDSSGNIFDSEGFSGGAVLRIDTTPDPVIDTVPASGLTSQTATFSGAASEVDLWGISDYSWDLANSGGFPINTGLTPTASEQFNTPGTYPISLQVTGTNGRVASTTINYNVGNSSASFTSPASALTGQAVTFNASPSELPYSTVTDYAWDFDGSSSYADDAASSPTINHTFATPGTYTVQLRVTRAGGRVDTVGGTIRIAPAPPPGLVGVSIDGGIYATNNPHVTVELVWPAGATQALISNDGGFGAAGNTTTLTLAPEVAWTLKQTGEDRLPKTVYVRFLGAGNETQNFTDDIILDQLPPDLESAQLVGGRVGQASIASHSAGKTHVHSYEIKVKAKDTIAGVCAVQASSKRTGGATVDLTTCRKKGVVHLSRLVKVKLATKPQWVRVRNSAGDWSRWLKLRV